MASTNGSVSRVSLSMNCNGVSLVDGKTFPDIIPCRGNEVCVTQSALGKRWILPINFEYPPILFVTSASLLTGS